jgi:hypothetical protein
MIFSFHLRSYVLIPCSLLYSNSQEIPPSRRIVSFLVLIFVRRRFVLLQKMSLRKSFLTMEMKILRQELFTGLCVFPLLVAILVAIQGLHKLVHLKLSIRRRLPFPRRKPQLVSLLLSNTSAIPNRHYPSRNLLRLAWSILILCLGPEVLILAFGIKCKSPFTLKSS